MGYIAAYRATEAGIAAIRQKRATPTIDWEAIARGRAAREAKEPKPDPVPAWLQADLKAPEWFAAAHSLIEVRQERQTMQRVIRRICKATNTPEALVRGTGRSRGLVRIRQACMYWCRRLLARSFTEIGKRFSDRDHSTVMHNIRAYPERRQKQGRHLRQIMPPVGAEPAVKPLNRELKP